MDTPTLIGLSAQLQNGKDTVAALILKNAKDQWKTKRFAGKLKEMSAILLSCTVESFEDIKFKDSELGEEWRRWYYSDYKMVNNYSNPEGKVSKYYGSEDEAKEYYPKHSEYFKSLQLKNEILTPRKILQLVGTEGGRDVIHPNIWVNATLGNLTPSDYTVITDVRFPNEVKGIKRRGGKVIRIIRPSLTSTSIHPSETSLNDYNDWDYVIKNDSSIEDLERKVIDMLKFFNF